MSTHLKYVSTWNNNVKFRIKFAVRTDILNN